ncbi:hypothetical protein TVAG_235080 [Trichomonas vaginalis G3]|uniref:adenylate cyclase n=1 Tax=Trichomonas vaginalis (strain ATCC PRA-98 / G3) TaxID=412133 RepID=A2DPM7_TRIV3|nr:adenylate cyclase type 1 family [Trichomonas vaginalis G3]EAY17627.1 hypothetical protein TVAG_235080 [Trichomonas vaginalis G3]KAI5486128.1 adenylate cyclase type 1 family [Trichomonas vaginalis G3]|eukprot:XP_001329762.1 hypothetical protein [Trichomonas vaginalis G3]
MASIAPSVSISTTNTSFSSSGSTSDEATRSKKRLESTIFPLFSEMSRFANIPRFVLHIELFISLLQSAISSLWIPSSIRWPDAPTFFKGLVSIVDFGQTIGGTLSHTIVSAIEAAISIIILGIYIICYFSYAKKRTYQKWQLYLLRVLLLIILPLILPAVAASSAYSFVDLLDDPTPQAIVFSFVDIIMLFALSLVFYYSNGFTVKSPIVIRNNCGQWNHNLIPFFMFTTLVSTFLSVFVDEFPNWISTILGLCLVASCCYCIYKLTEYPIYRFECTLIYSATFFFSGIAFLIAIIDTYVKFPWYVILFVPVVLSPICAVCYNIYLKKGYIAIKNKLIYKAIRLGNDISDSEKTEYFETFVFKNTKDAIRYLHIGLVERCDLLLDFSFIRYIVTNYAEKTILEAVIQIVSFFPSELQLLTSLLVNLSNIRDPSLIEQFLIYQVTKIHLTRQSAVSNDARNHIAVLRNKAQKVTAMVRCFWSSIATVGSKDISMETYHYVHTESMNIDSAFGDSTERFPSNASLCEEYATFLVEALGNYHSALRWKSMAASVEIGRKIPKDPCFQSIVNVVPELLFEHCVDINGQFIKKGPDAGNNKDANAKNSFSSSGSFSSSSMSAGFEAKKEEHPSNFLKDGIIRLALQSALRKGHLKMIQSLKYFMFISLITFIVVFIIIFIIVPYIAESSLSNVLENQNFARASASFIEMTTGAGFLLAKYGSNLSDPKTILYDVDSNVNKYLNTSDLPSDGIFKQPELWTHRQTLTVVDSLTNVLSSIVQGDSSRDTIVSEYINGSAVLSGFGNDGKTTYVNMSIKDALNGVINNVKFGLGISPIQAKENQNNGTFASILKTAVINGVNLPPFMLKISEMLNDDGYANVKQVRTIIYVLSYALPILLLIVFEAFAGYVIYYFVSDIHRISATLRTVKPDIIKESVMPIIKSSGEKPLDSGGSLNMHMSESLKTLIPFVVILYVIASCLVILFSTNIFSELDSFQQVFELYKYSSNRHTYIYHFVNTMISYAMGQINQSVAAEILEEDHSIVDNAHKVLMNAGIGYDDSLDTLQLSANCSNLTSTDPTRNPMRAVSCQSMDKKVNYIIILMKNRYSRLSANASTVLSDSEMFTETMYMMYDGLLDQLNSFNDRLADEGSSKASDMILRCRVIIIVGIIIDIAVFIILYMCYSHLTVMFDGVKQLISLLPPRAVLSNKMLLDLVLGEDPHMDDAVMTFGETMIASSSNVILSLTPSLIIESANPALKQVTGYSSDVINHQPFTQLLPDAGANNTNGPLSGEEHTISVSTTVGESEMSLFYKDIERIRTDKDFHSFSRQVVLIGESGEGIPVQCTVIAVRDEQGELTSIIVEAVDRTKILEQKEQARQAKRRAAKMLKGILPLDAYRSIKSGQESVFTSDSVVVSMISIEGISELISVMQPSAVMSLLHGVYQRLDELRGRFTAVDRLTCDGKSVMCIAGLFTHQTDPEAQALQSVSVCLRLRQEIASLNETGGVSLWLTTVCHVGGPVIGSLLEPKNPTFGIAGKVVEETMQMIDLTPIGTSVVCEEVASHLPTDKFGFENCKVGNFTAKTVTLLPNTKI